MASTINPANPITGTPTTQSVRDNFAAAKAEIEALQTQIASIMTAFSQPAIITADYPNGTSIGTPSANIWQTRPLNTILNNGGFLLSLTDNAFTLPAGLYHLRAEFQSYKLDRTLLRLQDTTNDTTLDQSINSHMAVPDNVGWEFNLESRIHLPATTTLRYEQIFTVANTSNGWGIASQQPGIERFARVTIQPLPQ